MISYRPFFATLKAKNISQYDLITKHNVPTSLLARLRKNENITALTIETLCNALDCTPNDILEFYEDSKK